MYGLFFHILHVYIKSMKSFNCIAVVFEVLILAALWIYLEYSNPNGLIIHKTGATPDSFSSVNYLFCKGIGCFLVYLLCTCALIPFIKLKNFFKILPMLIIFGLYVFNVLIFAILSLNRENIAIEILSMALLFLIPIFGIYFFLCIIMEVAGVEPAS